MQPTQFISNLEQSKKLKELGITQATYFYWHFGWRGGWLPINQEHSNIDLEKDFAAYCETELAVMLDAYYETYRTENDRWHGGQSGNGQFDTPAQASASRLIWMLEKDEEFTVEIANQRLLAANKI